MFLKKHLSRLGPITNFLSLTNEFYLLRLRHSLARLIVLQSKDMASENILYEVIAIFILAVAATILIRI
jgi:hypothetical protein